MQLEDLRSMSKDELILYIWDNFQSIEKIFKYLYVHYKDEKMIICQSLDNKESFYGGDMSALINCCFEIISDICKRSNLNFNSVLAQALTIEKEE